MHNTQEIINRVRTAWDAQRSLQTIGNQPTLIEGAKNVAYQ